MRKIYLLAAGSIFFSFIHAQTTVNIVADRDNTMYSISGNSNGLGDYFFAGRSGPLNSNSLQRALLHFDLSSIPAGSVISSATLTLYFSMTAAVSTGVDLHKVTADWGEGTSHPH